MIPTKLTELLGIQYPIFQGGMAWVADGRLAASVSEAGGLGFISAMALGRDYVKEQIDIARSITDKPFGVNIMLMSPYAEEIAELVIEEKIPVISTGAGNPAKYMKRWNEAGIKVIPVVASVALAKLVERSGAFAVIAEGTEAGGHVGELTTMVLVPQICDAVTIPVIAAGGIADGRTYAASLILGASGIQMGTRFLVATECSIHQNYKDKVLKAKDISTIVTGKRSGHPVRSLKTNFSRTFYQDELEGVDPEELESRLKGSLRKAVQDGDEEGSFMAGQSSGLVKKEQSVQEILLEITEEADALLRRSHE